MASSKNLSQGEMLEPVHRTTFDQREKDRHMNRVSQDTIIKRSPESRWWRTDSPCRKGEPPDCGFENQTHLNGSTHGVLGHGQRSGPSCHQSTYRKGCGAAAHFQSDRALPPTISGYSGHISGKYAGNIVGGTYRKTNEDAVEHLKSTAQTSRYGSAAFQQQ